MANNLKCIWQYLTGAVLARLCRMCIFADIKASLE